jgi:hypothetical protein
VPPKPKFKKEAIRPIDIEIIREAEEDEEDEESLGPQPQSLRGQGNGQLERLHRSEPR